MAHHPSEMVNISPITTASQVVVELQLLDSKLSQEKMGEFALFNHAYLIITQRICEALSESDLGNRAYIDDFVVIFAKYYFDALNQATRGTLPEDSPWSALKQFASITHAPVFLSLMLGANAHINYDLPRALGALVRHTGDRHAPSELVPISKILIQSGKEITQSFSEPRRSYDFLKKRFRFTYFWPAMFTILKWRAAAWRDYHHLQHNTHSTPHDPDRSNQIAHCLLRIAHTLAYTKEKPS